MKNRWPWIVAAAIVLGIAIFQLVAWRAARTPAPVAADPLPPPPPEAMVLTAPPPAAPLVQIQPPPAPRVEVDGIDVTALGDRTSIDLSSGRPVVTQDKSDAAAIDRALREMAEATKDMTFTAPVPRASSPAKK